VNTVAETRTRTWTIEIPAPTPMQTSNRREHWTKISKRRKAWRETAYGRLAAAGLPKGLARIRIDVELRFTDRRRRDAPNYYSDVIKPCVDATAAEKRVKAKDGGYRVELGWGLIPDDTAEYLDLTAPRIGQPVPRIQYPFGLVVLTITDLSEGDAP